MGKSDSRKITPYFPIVKKFKPMNNFPIFVETKPVNKWGKKTHAQFPNNKTITNKWENQALDELPESGNSGIMV